MRSSWHSSFYQVKHMIKLSLWHITESFYLEFVRNICARRVLIWTNALVYKLWGRSIISGKLFGSVCGVPLRFSSKFATILYRVECRIILIMHNFLRKRIKNVFCVIFSRAWSISHTIHIWAKCNCLFSRSNAIHEGRRLFALGPLLELREVAWWLVVSWTQEFRGLSSSDKETVKVPLVICSECH